MDFLPNIVILDVLVTGESCLVPRKAQAIIALAPVAKVILPPLLLLLDAVVNPPL